MEADQLAAEYEHIRQQLRHALSERVRDMGAACMAMDRLGRVQAQFKVARQPLAGAPTPTPRVGAAIDG